MYCLAFERVSIISFLLLHQLLQLNAVDYVMSKDVRTRSTNDISKNHQDMNISGQKSFESSRLTENSHESNFTDIFYKLLWPEKLFSTCKWKDIQWSRKNDFHNYPISKSDFERSFYEGSGCSFLKFVNIFKALDEGRQITIAVLGGSMTAGKDLSGDKCRHDCAWPSKLKSWFQIYKPKWNIQLKNIAALGHHAELWAAKPDWGVQADIYIVDTCMNNNGVEPYYAIKSLDSLLWRITKQTTGTENIIRPAILMTEIFKLTSDPNDQKDYCKGMDFESLGNSVYWCNSWWHTADISSLVGKYYGIPIANYRDAVWPMLNNPPKDLGLLYRPMKPSFPHPYEDTHELFADVVKYAFIRLIADYEEFRRVDGDTMAREHVHSTEAKDVLHDCEVQYPYSSIKFVRMRCPADKISTNLYGLESTFPAANLNSASTLRSGTPQLYWRNYEDIKGKPGWHMYYNDMQPSNNYAIYFNVTMGLERQIEISFLRSYFNMTSASLQILGCSNIWELNGDWKRHISIPYRYILKQSASTSDPVIEDINNDYAIRMIPTECSLVPFQNYLLKVFFPPTPHSSHKHQQRVPGRFKLLSIWAC